MLLLIVSSKTTKNKLIILKCFRSKYGKGDDENGEWWVLLGFWKRRWEKKKKEEDDCIRAANTDGHP